MPGLIQKSGYIKPGNGGSHYAEYIATREGVELIEAPPPSHDGGGYLEYMAQRPRSHGLFSADGPADLEKTMEEINGHTGPVWTFVYSLKREDAHRLGYENGESWRRLLLAHQAELATAMKIPPSNFRWCAAFHDEKHHPHIHMMVWSADPKQGFLTEKGIEKMRSQLSNEIFRDELLSLYQQKDLSYSQVRDAATEAMGRLIREAERLRLGTFTFEDASMKDEVDEDQDAVCFAWNSSWRMAEVYQSAKEVLEEYENPEEEKAEQVQVLEQLWQRGFPLAAYQLGKCWRDGRGVLPDDEQAELWFQRAADAGYDFAQYALGKFLQGQNRTNEAVSWYGKAAAQENTCAAYRLGKLYLEGKDVPKDVQKAVAYLTDSAEHGNQYAQYALGKLYLTGQGVKQDRERAWAYFYESAEQGNEYADFFLEHFDQVRRPNVFLAATRLLHHLSQIFRDNSVPPAAPVGQRVDRKLRRKIQEKKIAMGHKPDDHEETPRQDMGGMTMGW